jgi:hypothetical protein
MFDAEERAWSLSNRLCFLPGIFKKSFFHESVDQELKT